jgi:bifunctional non-homologous end joining protein LigD
VAARNQVGRVPRDCSKDEQPREALQPAGNELRDRFPLIVDAVGRLRVYSCIIDGVAVACGPDGIACFEKIRRWDTDDSVFMWAFDLIEFGGRDMRRAPVETRKATLEGMLSRADPGIRYNEHITGDGAIVFQNVCKLVLRELSPSAKILGTSRDARCTGLN